MFKGFSKEDLEVLRYYGYSKRKYKSPGLCDKCGPDWVLESEMSWRNNYTAGHEPENCRNPPFCGYHDIVGHTTTDKCKRYCPHCMKWGHSMRFCRKIKTCNLCGKFGHNPYSCWKYSTLQQWADRAKELNRCMQCLSLCTTETNCIDKDGHPNFTCRHCGRWRVYWDGEHRFLSRHYKESQTETNTEDQEIRTELIQAKEIIEKQNSQINELSNKVSDLENKLANSISENNGLKINLKQCITHEKEQALQKIEALELACHKKDVELQNANSIIEKMKAVEHAYVQPEHYNHLNVQPSKVTPVVTPKDTTHTDEQPSKVNEAFMLNTHQPCPPRVASDHLHYSALKCITSALQDLQAQQQKMAVILSHVYYGNRGQVQDTANTFKNYPSFNFDPHMGLLDTGQYFSKLHQM